MKFVKLVARVLGSFIFMCSASADVIYQNGVLDGTFQSAQISPRQSLSDSFFLDNPATLSGATIGLWSPSNAQPESLTWSIGSSAFGDEWGTGAVLLSNTKVAGYTDFDVYLATFDLTVALPAGQFWFTLSDGTSSGGAALGWDMNSGPSTAFYRNDTDAGEADSEYFKLEGTQVFAPGPTPVPAPATLAIFAIGLMGMAMARRRLNRPA